MLVRLVVGLVKGLVLGALAGYGLVALGFAVPSALVAYPAAAVLGVLVACLAGKPIWAKESRIEVGMKAAVAAVLAPLMLLAARSWLTVALPIDLPGLLGAEAPGATLGTFAMSSFGMVAALLAGFFDADNDPGGDEEAAQKKPAGAPKKRVQAAELDEAAEAQVDLEAEREPARRKRRS